MGGSRFEVDRRGIGEFLRSSQVQDVCVDVAEREAQALRGRTAVDTGATRDSTTVDRVMYPDRAGAEISQGGAAVPLQWGNERTRADRHAMPGGGGSGA